MSSSTVRLVWVALAIAALPFAPRAARADDSQPPPPPGYPPVYQGPPSQYAPPPQAYEPPASGPEEITDFDDARPVPPGYTKVSRTRKGLVIGGAVTFGVTYGISAFVAAIGEDLRKSDPSSADVSAMWLPVAGPFVQMGRSDSSIAKLYLFHAGLAQTAGAIMLVYGLTSPRTILVRNDQLAIAPMIGDGASGVVVSGRF